MGLSTLPKDTLPGGGQNGGDWDWNIDPMVSALPTTT